MASDARLLTGGVWYDYRRTLEHPVVLDLALAFRFENGILGMAKGMRVNFGLSNLTGRTDCSRERPKDGTALRFH